MLPKFVPSVEKIFLQIFRIILTYSYMGFTLLVMFTWMVMETILKTSVQFDIVQKYLRKILCLQPLQVLFTRYFFHPIYVKCNYTVHLKTGRIQVTPGK